MPPALASLIDQTSLAEIEIGMSEARVFSADSPAGTPFYLKVASTASIDNLRDEQTRLLWLQKDLPVPEVVHFEEFEGVQYLLLTAVPGVVSFHESLRDRLPDVVLTVGESLRLIHALPIDECPFDTRLAVRLDAAKNRLRSGQIRRELFEAPNQGIEPAALYDRLVAHIPDDEDPVFTHGDYCMPNVLLDPDSLNLTGFIDWGRAGVSDRYQDLALAARSIEFNLGSQWVKPFFVAYGIEEPDEKKVAFYRLLDELF
jgi:aminoglycoside phosphotransferase